MSSWTGEFVVVVATNDDVGVAGLGTLCFGLLLGGLLGEALPLKRHWTLCIKGVTNKSENGTTSSLCIVYIRELEDTNNGLPCRRPVAQQQQDNNNKVMVGKTNVAVRG